MVRYMAELPPSGKYPTAQERLKLLIGSHIAPVMKEAGFKKLGKRFGKRNADGWAVLDIQTSQWSNRDELHFYVNLAFRSDLIASLSEDEPAVEVMPTASRCHISLRLEQVTGQTGQDWIVESEYDASEMGTELQSLIRSAALPWLEKENNASLFGRIVRDEPFGITLQMRAARILIQEDRNAFQIFADKLLAGEETPYHHGWRKMLHDTLRRADKLGL